MVVVVVVGLVSVSESQIKPYQTNFEAKSGIIKNNVCKKLENKNQGLQLCTVEDFLFSLL